MFTDLISKRAFLKAAGASFAASLLPGQSEALERADAVFASAFMAKDKSYGVALLTEAGKEITRVALPDRGHAVSFDPTSSRAVAFARRPGTFALVFDAVTGQALKLIEAAEDRHFFGHGAFSAGGKLLYVAENDFDNYAGMIGVYDTRSDYRKIGEFPAHGMDTHDIQIIEGGRYLAIANGGIKQHPDTGRVKLNIDHMEPSLAIVDLNDGRLVEKHDMPADIRQLSTRHMDTDNQGRIWFGCQFEGARNRRPPLLGHFKRGEQLTFIDIPADVLDGFDNYIGTVDVNQQTDLVAISSPQGGQWAAFETRTGKLAYQEKIAGVCGLSPARKVFARSTEEGWFDREKSDVAWDNHITRLG
ncbi:MAG: hypothetical protein JWM58_1901 [Rhizobium sp.]|nr:hypothetical protein [Rhizobium sp.]